MSGLKSVFRDLKDAVLKGLRHTDSNLPRLTGNISDQIDTIRHGVRDLDATRPPALTGRSTTRVDRTSTETLYRSDNRPPSEIFRDGFQVRDAANNDYDSFVRFNTHSNFVSTTRDPDLYRNWPADYRYAIDAPGGIDADRTIPDNPFGPTSPAPESEVSFQGGVQPHHIVGAHPVNPDNTLGDWIPNPGYGGR